MSSPGFLVRVIDDETRVKDLIYNKSEHTVFPTFDAVLKKAQLEAERLSQGKVICLVRGSSELECIKNGFVRLYSINRGHSTTEIMAFALYNKSSE